MARFLETMKHAECARGESPPSAEPLPSLPENASFTVHVEPTAPADFADDQPVMPFIEVGPSRSVEGSPDVLAYATSPRPASSDGGPIVTFRPLSAPVSAAAGIAPEVVAFYKPEHAASGQYRELLASILCSTSESAALALMFTAPAAGIGTTTVVLNLAVTAARQGRRVVVVDGNARRPAVAARLALCDRPGLGDVLAGTATLEEALQETAQPGLAALTNGSPGANTNRAAESYRSLLRQLRQRYDLALVDGPRWEVRPEAIAPGVACDAAFLVLSARECNSHAVENLLHQLAANGIRIAGSIVAAR